MTFKNSAEAIAFAKEGSKYTLGIIYLTPVNDEENIYTFCLRTKNNTRWTYNDHMGTTLRNVIRQMKLKYRVVGTFRILNNEWYHYCVRWIIEK